MHSNEAVTLNTVDWRKVFFCLGTRGVSSHYQTVSNVFPKPNKIDFRISFSSCIADKEVKGTGNVCVVKERPNLSVIELSLSSLFGAGVAMSSWTWTSNTFRTWKKLWHRYVRMATREQKITL